MWLLPLGIQDISLNLVKVARLIEGEKMKKEKKNFIVVCALLVSVLAGCGPSQESKKEKGGGGGTAYGKAALRATLTGSAVDAEGMIVSANSLLDTDYLLIYFSAHWCPPCRQ